MSAALILADSAAQVVQDWRVIGIITLGGLASLYIKQRGDGIRNRQDNAKVDEKVSEIKEQVVEVKEQVANNHTTNLRDDVTRGLKLMEFTVGHVRQLPTNEDIARLTGKLEGLGRSLDAERTARRDFEAKFRRQYPELGD